MGLHDGEQRRKALIRLGELFGRIDRAIANGDFRDARGMLPHLVVAMRDAAGAEFGSGDHQDEIDQDPSDPTVRQSHVRGLKPVDVAATEIEPSDSDDLDGLASAVGRTR
jgi:hypothetical protein